MFYTYIIRSINHPNQRYIGSTSDLRKRLAKHNEGGVPHTAPFKPWKLEVYFAFETKEKAASFEVYRKSCAFRSRLQEVIYEYCFWQLFTFNAVSP